MPEELKMLFSARYKNVYCANDVLQENVREKIDLIVKSIVTNIPCVRNTTCKLEDVTVTDCDKANRRRRSLRQAGFSLKITSRPNEGKLLQNYFTCVPVNLTMYNMINLDAINCICLQFSLWLMVND